MAGIDCKCGRYISTDSFPSEYGFRMFSEAEFDNIEEPVTRRTLESLFLQSSRVYRCPYCSRLIILKREGHGAEFFIRE